MTQVYKNTRLKYTKIQTELGSTFPYLNESESKDHAITENPGHILVKDMRP